MKNQIPNFLTLLNLFCGCCGIVACMHNQTRFIPIFIGIALLADFLDGFVARALNAKSDIGAQLDSLADMVTFGVLPGMLIYAMVQNHLLNNIFMDFGGIASQDQHTADFFTRTNSYSTRGIPFFGFIYSIFACVRLAKFNIDDRQSENFLGLPTPAGAMFVLGLYMNFFSVNSDFILTLVYSPVVLLIITVLLAVLMVIELPMFSLKFNSIKWSGNEARFIFLVMAIPQPFIFKWLSLSTIIMTYVGWSVLLWMRSKLRYND